MNKNTKPKAPIEQYVVGRREEGFCWLLPSVDEEDADDQNLKAAKRFQSLAEAISVSTDADANVFELTVDEDGNETITELKVDFGAINSSPFDSAYWLMDSLLLGPNPICATADSTRQRIKLLKRAGVRVIVSLLSRGELCWADEQKNDVWFDAFVHHVFPIHDGGVPTRGMMVIILDVIDEAVSRDQTIYLHCWGGRGRTGLVAACFAARHGVATGQSVLNFLAEKRLEAGLFTSSPETELQRTFARNWKRGE